MNNSKKILPTNTLNDKEVSSLFDSLKEGDIIPFLCSGTSMIPTLLPGTSIVYLQKTIPDSVKRGNIVFFLRKNGKPVLHRVLRINIINNKKVFVMNGDSQNWTENIIENQIVAKVIGIRRKGNKSRYRSVSSLRYLLWSFALIILKPFRPVFIRIYYVFVPHVKRGN